MPIRVTNLRLGLDEPLDALPDHLGRLLSVRPSELDWRILRKSLDTRDKRDIHFVCNAEVRVADDETRVVQAARKHAGLSAGSSSSSPLRPSSRQRRRSSGPCTRHRRGT